MCKFWSCIVDRNYKAFRGIGSARGSESHTSIMGSHGIVGADTDGYAKIEIRPPSGNRRTAQAGWTFIIDTFPRGWTPNRKRLEAVARQLLAKDQPQTPAVRWGWALNNWRARRNSLRESVAYQTRAQRIAARRLKGYKRDLATHLKRKPRRSAFKEAA